MKSSEILRKAAKGIEEKEYSEYACIEIAYILGLYDNCGPGIAGIPKKVICRLSVVKPRRLADGGGYWAADSRGPRIIGLCLAAAIAESEGD